MAILKVIQDFGNWFWGIPILILIGGGGLFLTIYLGFPQLRHFGYAMSQTFGKVFAKKEEGKVRPISAAFAALACAVGASGHVLRTLIKAGPEALRQELRTWSEHVRTLMTLLGAANVSQLRRTDVLVTGSTAERARLLGVDLTGLAHRSDS